MYLCPNFLNFFSANIMGPAIEIEPTTDEPKDVSQAIRFVFELSQIVCYKCRLYNL